MATVSVTYTFTNGTDADADEVNQNFTDLVTFINTDVIHRDASVAFTATPSGPASDPTTDNQLSRKKYVDDQVATKVATSHTHDHNDVTDFNAEVQALIDATSLGGDLGGTIAAPTVDNDSHNHTGATISDLDAADIAAGTFPSGAYQFTTRLGIGGSDATRILYAEGSNGNEIYRTTSTAGDGIMVFTSDVGGTQQNKHIFYADGDATFSGTLTESSDFRLKDNIAPIGLPEAVDRVMSWDLKSYDKLGKPGRGVIAQDLQGGPCDDLVKDGEMLSVNYIGMLPDLARVVQALADKAGLVKEV